MEVKDGNIDVVQQLGVVLDRIATREEDDHFLFHIFLEEGEEEEESAVGGTDNVAL